jgi:hypothetical protein
VSADSFRETLVTLVEEHMSRPVSHYTVVLPLNIRRCDLSPIDILGVTLTPQDWSCVQDKMNVRDWFAEARRNRACDVDHRLVFKSIPLVAQVSERSPQEAFRKPYDVFHLFRSAYNLLDLQGRYFEAAPRWSFGCLSRAPIYGVFDQDGKCAATFLGHVGRPFEEVSLSPDRAGRACSMIGGGSEQDATETQRPLRYLLQLYGHAVDSANRADIFMNLWCALERATYPEGDRKYDMTDVAKRAAALLQDYQFHRDVLIALSKVRNDLTHRQDFPDEGLIEAEVLRKIVEGCLSRFGDLAKEFSTWAEMEQFYKHAPSSGHPEGRRQLEKKLSALESERRVIEAILRRRDEQSK